MYLHCIRSDINKFTETQWVLKLDKLLQANSIGVIAELKGIRNNLK